jgi:cleavage and polyadenylation specificity factor subunit 3
MTRFKSKLLSLNANRTTPVRVFSPANCEELRIPFDKPKYARVVGRLAREHQPPKPGDAPVIISGVMVRNEDHQMSFMAPDDLPEYAGLPITTITERLHLNLGIGPELIRYGLSGYFGHIEEVPNPSGAGSNGEPKAATNGGEIQVGNGSKSHPDIEDKGQVTTFLIMDTVLVYVKPGGLIELVWEGNAMNDSIGDAVVSALTGIAMTPAGVKCELN